MGVGSQFLLQGKNVAGVVDRANLLVFERASDFKLHEIVERVEDFGNTFERI